MVDLGLDALGEGIGFFDGEKGGGLGELARQDHLVDGFAVLADVVYLHDPVCNIMLDSGACEANLDGTIGEVLEVDVFFRIPLDADVGLGKLGFPMLDGGVEGGIEVGKAGIVEESFKSFALDLDGEDVLLVLFGGPARPVHHPEKRGLDPGHAVHAEGRGLEGLVPGGGASNVAVVGLVDGDGAVVEYGSDGSFFLLHFGFGVC